MVTSHNPASSSDSGAAPRRDGDVQSPDHFAAGLLPEAVDSMRYDSGASDDPYEVPGLFKALMPQQVRVLDIGCGTGGITMVVNAGKRNTVIAIEPDEDRANLARSRGLDVHQRFFDEAFIEEQAPFDVVMLSDVLEHLADPTAMLKLVARALKPGGLMLLSVPNVAHWTVRASLLIGRFEYKSAGIMDATHLRWFTTKSLCRLIEAAGFEVRSVGHSAGAWMGEYRKGPLRFVPQRLMCAIVRRGVSILPNLIGCQHVVSARLAG